MEVLLILKQYCHTHDMTRLRYTCASPAHAAFIAFNFEPHCDNVFITKDGEEKPFIVGFEQFASWYNGNTVKDDKLTFKTKE